jgi:hypothetical protein
MQRLRADCHTLTRCGKMATRTLQIFGPSKGAKPTLRFILPYDVGVFMYAREAQEIPIVSDTQAYLDLYARGGRDLKQAEYLLERAIEPRWKIA